MLKTLFARTKDLSSEINDPRSMSVIHECWGKMYGDDEQWKEAFGEFFQAFKQYQEIGHARAKQCLKYVVIAGLLSQNQANPFDAQEARFFFSFRSRFSIAFRYGSCATGQGVRAHA